MNRTALLLFIVTFSHASSLFSAENQNDSCWSKVKNCCCCTRIRLWLSNSEETEKADDSNPPIDAITQSKSSGEYEFIDTDDDDQIAAAAAGHVESSATYFPRSSRTGTLRVSDDRIVAADNSSSSDSEPDLVGQLDE